ncbi:membrane protein (pseudogene) [Streptococcus pneumoniae]|nr:membrane protein (pseudogene) [Streptococcus pneumoniae]
MEHAIVTAVFICSFLIAFLLKNDGRNGLLRVVIAF